MILNPCDANVVDNVPVFSSDVQRSGSFSVIVEEACSSSRFLYFGHGNFKLAFRHCNSDETNL